MNLSTLSTVLSSGGLSSSARNAADSTIGDAFGSLLNGMAKNGSERAPTDGSSGQQNADAAASSSASVIVPGLTASDQQAAKIPVFTAVSPAGANVPTILSLVQFTSGKTGSTGAISKDAIEPTAIPDGQSAAGAMVSAGVTAASAFASTAVAKDQPVAGATVSANVVAAGPLASTAVAKDQPVAGTTVSAGVTAAGALVSIAVVMDQPVAGATVSADVIAAGSLAPTATANDRPVAGATISADVISTYSFAPTVVAAGGSVVNAIVSAGDAVAGAVVSTSPPIDDQVLGTTGIASVSLTGVSGGKPGAVSAQPTVSSEKKQQRYDAAVTATAPVQGNGYVANGPEVASLLTLAARAADAPRAIATPSALVSAASVKTSVASGMKDARLSRAVDSSPPASSSDMSTDAGLHATGSGAKKRANPESTDGSSGGAQVLTAAVPQVAAGLVATTGMLADATSPNASGVMTMSANVVAGAPAETSSTGKDAANTAASASEATQSSLAEMPQVATIDDPHLPLQLSANVSPVDAAIVPGTVQVEGHLGFLGGVPTSGTETPRDNRRAEIEGVASSGLATMVNSTGAPTASRRSSTVATAAASATSGAGVAGVTDTGSASAATIQDESSPTSPASVSPTSEPAYEEHGQVAPDMIGAATVTPDMSIVLQNPQTTAPVAIQAADGIATLAAAVPDDNHLGTQVAPARSMALQLSPAGLGTLTVHLHVVGRALDVRLEASEGSTAALIERDRDALSGALRGKDYQLQSLSVATQDATMPGGTNAERGTDAGSADSGSSGPSRDGTSFGERSGNQGSRETPDQAARPSRRPTEELVVERGDSSLFV